MEKMTAESQPAWLASEPVHLSTGVHTMSNGLTAHATSSEVQRRETNVQGRETSPRFVARDSRATGVVGQIVGTDPRLLDAIRQAELVAPLDSTVLLLGETGTGKELLARLIHERSARAGRPFVAINCAALPPSLIESELFGHEKGAFTSAVAAKPGLFELAHRGTLFLDEVGDLPLKAQAKLLRVLQDGQVQRVGGLHTAPVDLRVIAATNQHLGTAIRQKQFRTDLFYRISTFPIRLSPLRSRLRDVPLLARHFVRTIGAALRKEHLELDRDALDYLSSQSWPGNVRELHNVIERAVVLATGPRIGIELVANGNGIDLPASDTDGAIPLADAERQAILAALAAARWRISGRLGAAELLQVKATTLHAKMRRLGIRRPPKVPISSTAAPE
jgi:formate hydrogenlyase transcriptional activator